MIIPQKCSLSFITHHHTTHHLPHPPHYFTMCNCQSTANFGFSFCYCLQPTSASSPASQTEGALESPASPPRCGNQAYASEPLPEDDLEAASDADDDASTTITDLSSVFDHAGTSMDTEAVAEDQESVDTAIHHRFRQLSSAPVFAAIPPGALLSPLNGLVTPPPTSPLLPHFSTTVNFDSLLRPHTPTIITAPPSFHHFIPPAPTSGEPSMENRAFPSLSEENDYVRNIQETDVQWSSALGEARAGNAARRLGELWRVYGNEGRFVNGWFVSGDSTGEALEPLELEALAGAALEVMGS
jgi:hypothetical protein